MNKSAKRYFDLAYEYQISALRAQQFKAWSLPHGNADSDAAGSPHFPLKKFRN